MASANVVTFIFSDAADHRPYAGFNPSAYITPVMAKTDGGLLPTIIETLKTHPNCISYLKQLAGKFNAMWQWYERPNNANFYFYALHSSALRLSLVSFAIIGPLAIAGLVLSARDARRCAVLYLMVAFCIFVMLISYVLARFRVTFAAALLPFAAVAIVRIAEWLLSRRFIYVCLMVGGVILLWFWVTRPLAEGKPLIRYSDYGAAHINYYLPAVENACRQGDLQQAVDILEQSLRYEPRPHRPWTIHDSDIDDEQGRVTDYFVNVHILCADLLRQTGQIKAAERHQKQAIELKNSIERWQHRRSVK
jgi:tetratricopeptide (TPR) repeat protein